MLNEYKVAEESTTADLQSQIILGETLCLLGELIEKNGLIEMPSTIEVIERYGKSRFPEKRSVFPKCNSQIALHQWIGTIYQRVGTLLIAAADSGRYCEKTIASARVMLGPVN